ncbi:MAG: regulatory protein RecX [Blastocatellia bacterium]|nr:regulatory protein RecX [Blastocatellia bacterium]
MNDNYQKLFDRAIRILSRRSCSVEIMRKKLLEKGDPELTDRVVDRLVELGYLNDQNFALSYASNKLSVKALGKARLKRSLKEKSVPDEIIDETLSKVYTEDEEERLCDQALGKHLRVYGKPEDQKGAKKLFNYLLRLGFSYDMIMKKIRSVKLSDME